RSSPPKPRDRPDDQLAAHLVSPAGLISPSTTAGGHPSPAATRYPKQPRRPTPPTAKPGGNRIGKASFSARTDVPTMAVRGASTVHGRASHSQLTALAWQIIAAQNREIAQMTSWLHTWYHMPA